MSVCKFDGLDFEYKNHRVQVFVNVEFDPCPWTCFNVIVDGKDIDAANIVEEMGMSDYWCESADMAQHAVCDAEFQDFVKEIVDVYLKEVL
jgi:hypothetical protein